MTAPFPAWEWWAWLGGGIGLAVFALIAEHRERKAHDKELGDLKAQIHQGDAYHSGQLNVVGQISAEILGTVSEQARTSSNTMLRQDLERLETELVHVIRASRVLISSPGGPLVPGSLEEHKGRILRAQATFLQSLDKLLVQWKRYEAERYSVHRQIAEIGAQVGGGRTAEQELENLKRTLVTEAANLRRLLNFDFEG